jgi:prepilin-type processing-associated H-X9-DG protein
MLGLGGALWELEPSGSVIGTSRAVKQSEVLAPSRMVAIADANLNISGFAAYPTGSVGGYANSLICLDDRTLMNDPNIPDASYYSQDLKSAWATLYRKRHNGLWNTLLCDGHVEQLRASRLHQSTFFPTRGLPNPYWDDTVLSRWNRDNDSHNH